MPTNNKPSRHSNNKPQKATEMERFTIRRLAFWLSFSGVAYFGLFSWDVPGLAISVVVLILTLVSKLISVTREKAQDSDDD